MSCTSIVLDDVGKKFQHKWIFKGLSTTLNKNDAVSVTGNNGAGKSTLLKMLSGFLSPNKGAIDFYDTSKKKIARDNIFKEVTFAAPYIQLLSRLNLKENIDFYLRFQSLQSGLDTDSLIDLMELKHAAHKQVRFYSSGMQQRVKLAMAICADSSILILDEPTTNLDEAGADWYQSTLEKYGHERIVIIASNAQRDFDFCNRSLSVLDYKKGKV